MCSIHARRNVRNGAVVKERVDCLEWLMPIEMGGLLPSPVHHQEGVK